MKKTILALALAGLLLAPGLSRPAPLPAPGSFEGEIFYDLVYTSFEKTLHLRYTVKGSKVRIDWVDLDENDRSRTRVLRVKESSFVDWSGGQSGWMEEKEKGIHLDQVPPPEAYEPLTPSLTASKAQSLVKEEEKSLVDYETTYRYPLQKAQLPAGRAAFLSAPSKEMNVDLWMAGDAKAVTVSSSPLSVLSLQPLPALRDSPFPLVVHAQMKKTPGAMSMEDPSHLSYWMYAVKVIPKGVDDDSFRQEIKSPPPATPGAAPAAMKMMAMPAARRAPTPGHPGLQDAILGNGLFNKDVTVNGPATAK